MKKIFIKDLRKGNEVLGEFMILKILFKEIEYIGVILGDKTGDIKAKIKYTGVDLNVGDVINVKGQGKRIFILYFFQYKDAFL